MKSLLRRNRYFPCNKKTHGVDRIFVCAFRFSHHSTGWPFPSFFSLTDRDPTMDGAWMAHALRRVGCTCRHDEVSSTSTTTFGSWMPQLPTVGRRYFGDAPGNRGTVYQSRKGCYTKLYPIFEKEDASWRGKRKREAKESKKHNRYSYLRGSTKKPMCYQNEIENHYTTYKLVFRPLHTAPNDLPRYSNLPTRACPWGENPQVCCFLFEFFGVSLFSVPGGCVCKMCVFVCWFPLKFNFVLHFHLGSIPWGIFGGDKAQHSYTYSSLVGNF